MLQVNKMLGFLRGWSPGKVGWLLNIMQHVQKFRLIVFCQFHFLNYTWVFELDHSNLLSHVYRNEPVNLGKCWGRVLQQWYQSWQSTTVVVKCSKKVFILMRNQLQLGNYPYYDISNPFRDHLIPSSIVGKALEESCISFQFIQKFCMYIILKLGRDEFFVYYSCDFLCSNSML